MVQDFALAAEVTVDSALSDPGVRGYGGDGGRLVAARGEDMIGGFDYLPTPPPR